MDRQLAYQLFCSLLLNMGERKEGELSYELKSGGVITITVTIKEGPKLYLCKPKEDDAS